MVSVEVRSISRDALQLPAAGCEGNGKVVTELGVPRRCKNMSLYSQGKSRLTLEPFFVDHKEQPSPN
jgi:hypothetical protein